MMQDTFMNGIRDLKTASLIFVIGAILIIVASASTAAIALSLNIGALIAMYALSGIGALIGLIATFKLNSAVGKLDAARPGEYRTAGMLIKVLFLAFLLSMISGFWAAAIIAQVAGATTSPGALLAQVGTAGTIGLIGTVLTFIGYIGVLLMSIKLRDATGDSLFLVAGILIVIVFLAFIGWILMLIAANNALKRGVAPTPAASGGVSEVPPPPPPA